MKNIDSFLKPVPIPLASLILLAIEYALVESAKQIELQKSIDTFWSQAIKGLRGVACSIPQLQHFFSSSKGDLIEMLQWAIEWHSEEEVVNYAQNFINNFLSTS